MFKAEVDIRLITNLFSSGAKKELAEFRIPELKALLRATFREFFSYTSKDDLKNKEEGIFGNTGRKAPVSIRLRDTLHKGTTGKGDFVLHKNWKPQNCIKESTSISLIFSSYNIDLLELYIDILKIAAITGGMGKRSRKGMGAFKVEQIQIISPIGQSIENKENIERIWNYNSILSKVDCKLNLPKIINELEITLRSIERNSTGGYTHFSFVNILEDVRIKEEARKDLNIHFAKELYIIKINPARKKDILKDISELTHTRLGDIKPFIADPDIADDDLNKINKVVLGNYKGEGGIKRFASPVYVTLHQELQDNTPSTYLVIKVLNYDYLYWDDLKAGNKENDEKYVQAYIDKIMKLCGVKN